VAARAVAHYSVGVFGGDVKFNGGQAAGSATVSFLHGGKPDTALTPNSAAARDVAPPPAKPEELPRWHSTFTIQFESRYPPRS